MCELSGAHTDCLPEVIAALLECTEVVACLASVMRLCTSCRWCRRLGVTSIRLVEQRLMSRLTGSS